MEVYLDNSATTRPYDEVSQAVYNTMTQNYANPSSLHRLGKYAEDIVTGARETISDTIGCSAKELYFTSGGTESDNLAILGYCLANQKSGKRVITQKTEHKAVLETFKTLENIGFDVQMLGVDKYGFINIEELKSVLNGDTILVSLMYANNETGALMPIDEVSRLVSNFKNCALHVDAVQAYGKCRLDVKKQGIDMLTLSAHKIHGPKGIGALYIKDRLKVTPLMTGGGQERQMRSGTENVPAIAGFEAAAKIRFKDFDQKCADTQKLKEHLKTLILENIQNVKINTPENSVCSVLNVSFAGVKSEVLLHVLESKGIYVSTGSACNSKKDKYSYVLKEMGLNGEFIDSAVRFSLGEFNTYEQIEYTVDVLKREVPVLRKIMR